MSICQETGSAGIKWPKSGKEEIINYFTSNQRDWYKNRYKKIYV